MLSKQSATATPWLQRRDRANLNYQAGRRLTADCLDMHVSSEAQGSARVECVRLCECVGGRGRARNYIVVSASPESASFYGITCKHATSCKVSEYVISGVRPLAQVVIECANITARFTLKHIQQELAWRASAVMVYFLLRVSYIIQDL